MGGRLCVGVLAAFLLISVAVGVRDAASVGGRRVVTAKKEGERSEAGQGATAPPAEDSRLIPSSVPKDSAPPATSSDSTPAERAPPNPPAAAQKDSPLTSVSESLSNPVPAIPVSGSPSNPAPGGPVNPPPSSSGSPLDKSPPSGGPPPKSPTSDERSNPSPVLGNHPASPESKLPKPAPSGHGRETPTSGEDGKEKEKKQQPGTSPNPDGSQGKGQASERCNVPVPHRCHVKGLLACLQQSQNGAQKWFLLVQNEGENPLKVKILTPSSVKLDKSVSLPVSLPPHKASKINIQVDAVEGQNIVLETVNGNCTLHMAQQSSAGNFFQQIPNYANHVTPMHGVYLASLTVVFIGGTWACCQFRKRRVDAGVAYQQLEMGTQQQSSNALDDEGGTNGWDDGWNDDWDEEEAAPRPPEKRESASQNGAAFRPSDKNEWEDWDD